MTTDALPDLLADRGACSDCGTSMRACYAQAGSVCCGTCIHRAASTTGLTPDGYNVNGVAMCACKRRGLPHAWEPGEACSPTRIIPPTEDH